jgi:hypothetical protein
MSVNKELQFFIDKEPVSETELESKLLAMLANDKTKAIILRAEEGYQLKGSQRLRYCKSKPNQSCFSSKVSKTTCPSKIYPT